MTSSNPLHTEAALDVSRRRIYLMRHGEVSYFGNRRPSRVEQVGLNEEGRRQAQAMAEVMASVPLDRVISSPLLRCQETTAIVIGSRSLDIETLDALREIEPGPLDRLAELPLPEGITKAFAGDLTPETRFLGGETFGTFVQRVRECLDQIRADPDWRHLLVVAHGGTNRAILSWALGSDLKGFGHMEQDPACLNIVDIDQHGTPLVRLLNFTPYNVVKHGWKYTTMERLFLEYLSAQR